MMESTSPAPQPRPAHPSRRSAPRDGPPFLTACELASVLPGELGQWAPLLADALAFFLDALPKARRAELLQGQAALPGGTPTAVRLYQLARACPTLHKLGQVLARHRPLAADLRQRLQQLETLPGGPVPAELAALLATEPPAGHCRAGLRVGSSVLAEGSVAWVVPFEYDAAATANRTHDTGRGVLKVLKPDAIQRLYEELAIWTRLGAYLDECCANYGLPPLAYEEVFETLRKLLLSEVDVRGEQSNLAAAAQRYQHLPEVRVPGLLPFCTAKITAMERLDGVRLTDTAAGPAERRRLGALLVRGLLAEALWHSDESSPFHADPHGGNLLHLDRGGLGLLDWSLTGRLTKVQRVALMNVLLAGARLSPEELAAALANLSPACGQDRAALERVAADGVARLAARPLPGVTWLTELLDQTVRAAGWPLPAELLLFRKSLLTVAGVTEDLAADLSIDAVLLGAMLERLALEAPRRWFAPPGDAGFGSHISTAALWRLAAEAPLTAARWWRQVALGR